MCKQDTESVKVAPESVLSTRGNLEGTHALEQVFTGGGYLRRFIPGGGYLHTPYLPYLAFASGCMQPMYE